MALTGCGAEDTRHTWTGKWSEELRFLPLTAAATATAALAVAGVAAASIVAASTAAAATASASASAAAGRQAPDCTVRP